MNQLFAKCDAYRDNASITLTAIHPDGEHRSPSRHIALKQRQQIQASLEKLQIANDRGWGAFIGIGLRQKGLGRYRRGGEQEIRALPALFADVDDLNPKTLQDLKTLSPSCLIFTGGGYHAYWFLKSPLTDMKLAGQLLHGLAKITGGDKLNPAQSLRLPGSRNTKPERDNALCKIILLEDTYHPLSEFDYLLSMKTSSNSRSPPQSDEVNRSLLQDVTNYFIQAGYKPSGDWLSGSCIYPRRHRHEDRHASFGFNRRTAYGNCYVCGSMLLKDICKQLGIRPASYGGLFNRRAE